MRRSFLLFVPLVLAGCAAPTPRPSPTVDVPATVAAQVAATVSAIPTATVRLAPAVTPTIIPTATPSAFAVGAEAWIAPDAGSSAYLGVDDQAVVAYMKALKANDIVGVVNLSMQGKIVNAKAGAKVLVLDTDYDGDLVRVRLMEGPKAPQAGWIPKGWLVTKPPQ